MVSLLLLAMLQVPDSMVTSITIERQAVPQIIQVRDTAVVDLRVTTVPDTVSARMNAELVAALKSCDCRTDYRWEIRAATLVFGSLIAWAIYEYKRKPPTSVDVEEGDTNVEVNNPPHEPHDGHGRKGRGRGHDPGGE